MEEQDNIFETDDIYMEHVGEGKVCMECFCEHGEMSLEEITQLRDYLTSIIQKCEE